VHTRLYHMSKGCTIQTLCIAQCNKLVGLCWVKAAGASWVQVNPPALLACTPQEPCNDLVTIPAPLSPSHAAAGLCSVAAAPCCAPRPP
jgi:hypothetical protein